MGADIKYSVSFFILFFYFLCLFLGAYHIPYSKCVVNSVVCRSFCASLRFVGKLVIVCVE